MRVLPITARMEMNAPVSDDVGIFLLTITHPEMAQPIRISSDPTERISTDPYVLGTVSRGNTYLFLPMSVMIPTDKDEETPGTSIVLDNVVAQDDDGSVTTVSDLVRLSVKPATMLIEIVLASDPNEIVMTAPDLLTVNANYDAGTVNLELSVDGLEAEPFPALTFNPTYFGTL